MNAPTPILNLPGRHRRRLTKTGADPVLGGVSIPFYYTRDVVVDGTAMYIDATEADLVRMAVPGQNHGTKVIGFSFIETYDDSLLGQLTGTHFQNDTRLPIKTTAGFRNPPITILGGGGYAETSNYTGTVANGDQVAIASGGKLMASAGGTPAGDKLPAYFEGSGTDGNNMVRVRFDFPRAPAAA